MHQNIRIGRKSKIKYRLAALLMTVCLVLLTACGGQERRAHQAVRQIPPMAP